MAGSRTLKLSILADVDDLKKKGAVFVEELEEIGFMDYLDSKHVCLIEWPEIVEDFIDLPHISMQLEHADGARHYKVNLID